MSSTYCDKKRQKWNVCNMFVTPKQLLIGCLCLLYLFCFQNQLFANWLFLSLQFTVFSVQVVPNLFFHFERTKEKKIRNKKWKRRNRDHFNNHFCYNKRTSPSNFVETDPIKLKECRLQIWNFPVMILPDTLDLLIFQIKWVSTFNLS